jgi:hypothetical protein
MYIVGTIFAGFICHFFKKITTQVGTEMVHRRDGHRIQSIKFILVTQVFMGRMFKTPDFLAKQSLMGPWTGQCHQVDKAGSSLIKICLSQTKQRAREMENP